MSSVTDPYQPVERQLELTRGVLQAMADRKDKPKLVVQTRSPDVVQRLLNGSKKTVGVQVNMTVTTDDEDIRLFEPHAPKTKTAGIDSLTMTPFSGQSPYAFADSLLDTVSRSSSLSTSSGASSWPVPATPPLI